MLDKLSDTNGVVSANNNGHIVMGATWLAKEVANYFPRAECVGCGQWIASCPICSGKLIVLSHHATGSVGVACHGKGCSRDEVLETAGIDPKFAGLYRPEEAKLVQTPLDFLQVLGDTQENQLNTLEAFCPATQDDPIWRDSTWQDFLKRGAHDPAFYSALMRIMSGQFWRKDAIDNYFASLDITNPQSKRNATDETSTPTIIWQTALVLQQEELTPLRWCIDGLLPEGAAVLAGRPKKGKSLLALNIGVGIACGGKVLGLYDVEPGDVAYLALEDGKRRVKNRIQNLMPPNEPWPSRLSLTYAAPRMDQGLIDNLITWIQGANNPRLIIVDILAKVKPARRYKGDGDLYQKDYDLIAKFMEVAQAHGITILLITHTSKRDGDDIFDNIMGTSGITGGSATNLVLQRLNNDSPLDGILHVASKDAEDQSIGLTFNHGTWYAEGNAELYLQSKERLELFEILYTTTGKGLTPKELAEGLGKDRAAIRQMLRTLREQDLVRADKDVYCLTGKSAAIVKANRHELNSPPSPPSSGAPWPDQRTPSLGNNDSIDPPDTTSLVEVIADAIPHENGNTGDHNSHNNHNNHSDHSDHRFDQPTKIHDIRVMPVTAVRGVIAHHTEATGDPRPDSW